jgi:hypothetical protein
LISLNANNSEFRIWNLETIREKKMKNIRIEGKVKSRRIEKKNGTSKRANNWTGVEKIHEFEELG